MKTGACAIFALSLAATASPSLANTTIYPSRAAWMQAAGPFDTEDFETTPVSMQPLCPADWIDGCQAEITIDAATLDIVLPFGSHALGYDGIFDGGRVNGTREFVADLHSGVLVFGTSYNTIAFPQPITAFAVDLAYVFDCSFRGCVDFPLTFSISDEDFALAQGATFFGLTSTDPFTQVIVRATDPMQGGLVAPSLDNISFAAVPEPATFAMLAAGLAALAVRRRGA